MNPADGLPPLSMRPLTRFSGAELVAESDGPGSGPTGTVVANTAATAPGPSADLLEAAAIDLTQTGDYWRQYRWVRLDDARRILAAAVEQAHDEAAEIFAHIAGALDPTPEVGQWWQRTGHFGELVLITGVTHYPDTGEPAVFFIGSFYGTRSLPLDRFIVDYEPATPTSPRRN